MLEHGIMVNSGAGIRQRAAEKSIGKMHKKNRPKQGRFDKSYEFSQVQNLVFFVKQIGHSDKLTDFHFLPKFNVAFFVSVRVPF